MVCLPWGQLRRVFCCQFPNGRVYLSGGGGLLLFAVIEAAYHAVGLVQCLFQSIAKHL